LTAAGRSALEVVVGPAAVELALGVDRDDDEEDEDPQPAIRSAATDARRRICGSLMCLIMARGEIGGEMSTGLRLRGAL
jgi:hypothetical protein